MEAAVFLIFRLLLLLIIIFQLFYADGIFTVVPFSVTGIICRYPPAAEIVADRHPGVDGMRTDVSEIIAYRAYFAFVCAGCIGIIAGNVFVGVSQIRLHIRAAAAVFTCRLRCGREEKRREEKRREEKRRFFAGWIHFRLLIRFNRLKKKIFTDVEGRIISGSGRCFNKK
ncbi:Uncharacterised protein [Neisseria gonorrhoeae]|nr:Uncharacterised protein [Neisseria gonorrhoeae]